MDLIEFAVKSLQSLLINSNAKKQLLGIYITKHGIFICISLRINSICFDHWPISYDVQFMLSFQMQIGPCDAVWFIIQVSFNKWPMQTFGLSSCNERIIIELSSRKFTSELLILVHLIDLFAMEITLLYEFNRSPDSVNPFSQGIIIPIQFSQFNWSIPYFTWLLTFINNIGENYL